MIEIPNHLKDFVKIEKETESTVILKAICNCGSTTFFVLENLLDAKEESMIKEREKRLGSWKNIENYTDPVTNIRYLVTRNLFGKICNKIPVNEIRDIRRTRILKVKCVKCGKEKVLFDNRFHGYDAVSISRDELNLDSEFKFQSIQNRPTEVIVKITNDMTRDEKNELSDIANAFTNIEVISNQNGRKKVIFAEETA